MGLIITPDEQIEAYFASEHMSQSKLKKLLTGLDNFVAEDEDISKKPYIILGKAVDVLLTGNEEEFNNQFYISQITKKPTDKVADIVDEVYRLVVNDYQEYLATCVPVIDAHQVKKEGEFLVVGQENLDEPIELMSFENYIRTLSTWTNYVVAVAREQEYQARYGEEALIKAIVTGETTIYFNDLSLSYGKCIIDVSTYETIKSIVESLKTNLRTSKYFDRYEQAEYTHIDIILQMPIYFEYKGIKCKALLDMVSVMRDSDGKILRIQPIDLKTMSGNTYNFPMSIRSRRYDIQAAWYRMALADHYAINEISSIIAPFKFIVESTTKQGKPLVYEVSKELAEIGRSGRDAYYYYMSDGFGTIMKTNDIACPAILGVEQLVDMYLYHEDNGFEAEQEIIETDRQEDCLVVGWNGIVERSFIQEQEEEISFTFDLSKEEELVEVIQEIIPEKIESEVKEISEKTFEERFTETNGLMEESNE